MIDHLVLFKWQKAASLAQILRATQELQNLRHMIPEMISLSIGENFSDRNQGFDYGMVVRFKSRYDLAIYQEHPAHKTVVDKYLKPLLADILVVDFEFAT